MKKTSLVLLIGMFALFSCGRGEKKVILSDKLIQELNNTGIQIEQLKGNPKCITFYQNFAKNGEEDILSKYRDELYKAGYVKSYECSNDGCIFYICPK